MQGNKNTIIKWLLEQDDREFVIEEYKEKRSKNANSYFYLLVGKIADVLKTSKDDVHLDMLRSYGQSKLLPFLPTDTPLGYCKYFDFEKESELNGKTAHWYKCYKGSSEMNTKEMSLLIEGTVQDAKELSIETLDGIKLKDMVDKWQS